MSSSSRFVAIAARFRAVFFDQYGVLHDGRRAYPGAKEAMTALKSREVKVVVLSNSGRTSEANRERLASLGFAPDLYDLLITSGDVARSLLKMGRGSVSVAPGARCFTIGSDERDDFAPELGLASVAESGDADLVVVSGSQADRVPLERYREQLAPAAARGAPCLCVNPDKIMLTGRGSAPGPGRIAEIYEQLGGEVAWIGKPYSAIYEAAAKATGVKDPRDILCVGDSVEHDVAGAHAFGASAALVRTGILADLPEQELAAEIGRHGVVPDFVIKNLLR